MKTEWDKSTVLAKSWHIYCIFGKREGSIYYTILMLPGTIKYNTDNTILYLDTLRQKKFSNVKIRTFLFNHNWITIKYK